MIGFLLRVAIVVVIALNAPWWVTVLAVILNLHLKVNGKEVW